MGKLFKEGSLAERYLARSVIKHIRKQNKKLIMGAAVGNDYSRMRMELDIISTDACAARPDIAWVKAANNFACSGGICDGARIVMILPVDTKESRIKEYMAEFNSFAEAANVQILGGHTQVTKNCEKEMFCVTMIGRGGAFAADKRKIEVGNDIVMTKKCGLLGTDLILDEKSENLRERFANSYLLGARFGEKMYSIGAEAELACKIEGVHYMHDVSHGGIYGALWQLGSWMDRGFCIYHDKLSIRQETIEFCEFFNINPYMLDGTGALLLVCEDGKNLVEKFAEHNIEASVIGKVSADNERMIIVNEIDRRCLTPVERDEIYGI